MWSLRKNEKELEPLVFSNGKSQKDVVKEVLDAIGEGHKIIFIKGMCGTGKSAIALNIARNFGRASIVVPIKSLQEQYAKDYTEQMSVLNKENKEKLKIASIVGRNNFQCRFLKENANLVEGSFRERNILLDDIFGGKSVRKNKEKEKSCDNSQLPCKIEIKEKNIYQLKEYLKKNPDVNLRDFDSVKDIKRMSIASVCPYWSPVISDEYEIKKFDKLKKIKYKGLAGKNFVLYLQENSCQYYRQYEAYADADIIIFNSLKYQIETLMNRKPATDVEIIDECDEFLDNFANQEQINLSRILYALGSLMVSDENQKDVEELLDLTNTIKRKFAEAKKEEIFNLKGSEVGQLLEKVLEIGGLINEDEESYLNRLYEIASVFEGLEDESYFSVEREDNDSVIKIVTTNLSKRFMEIVDKNKILVMMSGTVHSENVLKNIFGIENFKIIEAETKQQGELIKSRQGYEMDCAYQNFSSGRITREGYLKAFSKAVLVAKRPTLIHLTSFNDLPTEIERIQWDLDNLPTQNEFFDEQNSDPLGERVRNFKNKEQDILFTTRCNRGVDFPGDSCNSIIISRFPYPNISSLFWRILKKNKPNSFRDFYLDKAKRELLQKIYRGLRSKQDKVELLSPDKRVIDFSI